jgi:hypothetical protein
LGDAPAWNLRVVCVLGMHRSGTSLIARILNLLGLFLGPDQHLMKATEDNPRGYWEHQTISDLNEEILRCLGGSWDAPPQFVTRWETRPDLGDLRQRASALLREDFAEGEAWGWRDRGRA